MGVKQTRTIEEVAGANLRFVVGNPRATYVNGKSKMSMATLDLLQAKRTLDYYEQMAMGEVVVFELVPVIIETDGSVTRQT